MTPFVRTHFIKDLFSPRGLLNSFEAIEFASISDFSDALTKEWLQLGTRRDILIYLTDASLPLLEEILQQTSLLEGDFFSFDISKLSDVSLIAPFLLEGRRFNLRINLDDIPNIAYLEKIPLQTPWNKSNCVSIDVDLNKESYKNNINAIIEVYTKTYFRHFNLDFNYESLNDLTFKEYEDLKFRLVDLLKVWTTPVGKESPLQIDIPQKRSRIYLDDGILKFHRFSEAFLDLGALPENSDGESLNVEALSRFRSYTDIPEAEVALSKKQKINNLVDPYWNKRIAGSYIVTPTITKVLARELEGFL